MSSSKDLYRLLSGINHRADLLPLLFTMKGEPYSLKDYIQFRELYVTESPSNILYMCGRQIGKSTNLAKSEVLDCIQIPNFQLVYIAPLQSQAQRYSTLYLKSSIRECSLAAKLQEGAIATTKDYPVALNAEIMKTVTHQSFCNGSGIQLTYAKTSSDRTRGITADRLDFDEIQDQITDNISIIQESLTNSKWAFTRYTGTAKTVDNLIEHLWRKSSKSEWTMKCSGCNHWNQPTLENNVFEMIQLKGVVCSKCGKLLDVRGGRWVASDRSLLEEFKGYHIPQIIVPAMYEDRKKWLGIVNKVIEQPAAAVLQEVLGISADKGARLLTEKNIEDAKLLPINENPPDVIQHLWQHRARYTHKVMGIDWGIAEQSSFTVCTVIGIDYTGSVDTLYARKFIGCDPTEILSQLVDIYNKYNCNLCAADFGCGFVYNSLLRTQYGIPVIAMQYASQNTFVRFNPLFGTSRWVVDRTSALTLCFLGIISKRIKFPKGRFIDPFKEDLLSLYETIIENPGGPERRVFRRNPEHPDDFTHALTFACLAGYHAIGDSSLSIVPDGALDFNELE